LVIPGRCWRWRDLPSQRGNASPPLLWETVTAFGHIKAPAPAQFGEGLGIDVRLLERGFADITTWQSSH
jgi:hypothetical protein